MKDILCRIGIAVALGVVTAPAFAQEDGAPDAKTSSGVVAPPSVDNGVANGIVKKSGSPSVGNGLANGVVKPSGSPSVDNGVANGSAKSTTIQQ